MAKTIENRLEYLRKELRAERISYGELAELQSLAKHIEQGDTELLEVAGIPEYSEQEENNKLIAEFMGRNISSLTPKEFGKLPQVDKIFWNDDFAVDLVYHTSWDWLMPVVEKCLEGEAEQSKELSNTTIKNIYEGICNQDISYAHNAVVKFIKWYNENK